MAFIFADRVKESSTSFGLGVFNLAGPYFGFQTFLAGIGDTNQCYYTIVHDTDGSWEVGLGTVSGASLVRDTVLSSSNSGAPVDFAPGPKTVFVPSSAQAFTERLTAADHALVDHQVGVLGVPAPEAFTEAAHNDPGFTHAGLPGVPGPETFTEADHNDPGFTHAGLPGIPVISAPAPATYNVNRLSSTTTVDLTSTTDGIHYISLGTLGTDFDILQVDIPPTPTDDTPFLVIFNEDANLKGGVLSISNGGGAPLVYLPAREGCRLWHTGALNTEWQVEQITPTNGFPAEVLTKWVGNVVTANDHYRTGASTTNNATTREGYYHDWPVISQVRYVAMSYRSDNVGIGDTTLFIDDETPSALESVVLTAGITTENELPLDFIANPVESAAEVDTSSLALRYSAGGDKNITALYAYGFSRTGGPVMTFRSAGIPNGSNNFLYVGSDWQANGLVTGSNNPDASLVCPVNAVIDRLTLIGGISVSFDLTIYLDDNPIRVVPVTITANVARLVQLTGAPIPVRAGARVAIRGDFPSLSNPDRLHVQVRFRQPRGCFLQFGGNADSPAVFGSPNEGYTFVEQNFVVPTPLRLLEWGWSADNMDNNDTMQLRRNGVTIANAIPFDQGFGGGSIHRWGTTDLAGFPVAAGDVLDIQQTGFTASNSHIIRVTAEPLTI